VSARVILVGTVHLDPEGRARLFALLHALRPSVVTIEVSRYAIEFRRGRGSAMLRRLEAFRDPAGLLPPALQAVEAQLALPFEYAAAKAYARESGARVLPVGDGRTSRALLCKVEAELVAPANLAALAALRGPDLAASVRCEWSRAMHDWDRERGPVTPSRVEERLAARVRRAAAHCRGRVLVHAGGWEHVAGLALALALADLGVEARLLRSL
jgi:hypothetical protein